MVAESSLFSARKLLGLRNAPKNNGRENLRYATAAQMEFYYAAWEAMPALCEAVLALRAIRSRIPVDVENEDANGWGRVDAALEPFTNDMGGFVEDGFEV